MGCRCTEYTNINGFGKCLKLSGYLSDYTCYVHQPSNCTDLHISPMNPEKMFSAQACTEGNLIWLLNETH